MSKAKGKPGPRRWSEIVAKLGRVDPRLGEVMRRAGPCTIKPRNDYFIALCQAILAQQISSKAAKTVWARFTSLFPAGVVEPRRLVELDVETLRTAGIGPQRQGYIKALATAVLDGSLPQDGGGEDGGEGGWGGLTDAEVMRKLTHIRGVGRWTAEMFLMFVLCREDVFPVDDLGLQTAAARLLGREGKIKGKELEKLGEKWRPYRTVASWYLWRMVDPETKAEAKQTAVPAKRVRKSARR
jgi:DNA-3-methyladenine glycosylase II